MTVIESGCSQSADSFLYQRLQSAQIQESRTYASRVSSICVILGLWSELRFSCLHARLMTLAFVVEQAPKTATVSDVKRPVQPVDAAPEDSGRTEKPKRKRKRKSEAGPQPWHGEVSQAAKRVLLASSSEMTLAALAEEVTSAVLAGTVSGIDRIELQHVLLGAVKVSGRQKEGTFRLKARLDG